MHATFSDLLKAVRKVLWKDNLIFRKHLSESFRGNNKGLDDALSLVDGEARPESIWFRLLSLVFSNLKLDGKKLLVTLREPFLTLCAMSHQPANLRM